MPYPSFSPESERVHYGFVQPVFFANLPQTPIVFPAQGLILLTGLPSIAGLLCFRDYRSDVNVIQFAVHGTWHGLKKKQLRVRKVKKAGEGMCDKRQYISMPEPLQVG